MNAQGDDDTDPDKVPDQVSGAVEDELDGDLLDNEDMSYLPCVSLLSTRAGILCIRNFKPGKSQLKLRNLEENHFKKSVVQVFLLGKHTPNFPTLAIY